jgi:hypothetical protein
LVIAYLDIIKPCWEEFNLEFIREKGGHIINLEHLEMLLSVAMGPKFEAEDVMPTKRGTTAACFHMLGRSTL